MKEEKETSVAVVENEQLHKENADLKKQVEGLIKRYKKLIVLYNEVLEKFLSE